MRYQLGLATLLFSAALVPAAHAANVFSLGNPTNGCCAALGGQFQAIVTEGWTDSSSETDVYIAAQLGGAFSGPGSITAYLMDQIGPGTTALANQIATVTVSTPALQQTVYLFTDLNLAAGTYYVVLTGDSSNNNGWAFNNTSDTLIEGATVSNAFEGVVNVIPGNSHGTPNAYAPASTFFNTNETTAFGESILVATAPEPSSLFLAGLSLIGLGAARRRRVL